MQMIDEIRAKIAAGRFEFSKHSVDQAQIALHFSAGDLDLRITDGRAHEALNRAKTAR